jgi:hypothetical protein
VRRAALIAVAAVGVIVLAGAVTWFVAFRDTAEPVTVDDAVTSFRTETEPAPVASPIPVGVYVYATRGYEKTDALTGVTHRYPRRSTITVAAADCGVSLTWRVLQGRSTEWIYCMAPDGWELRSQDERHTFFGTAERTTYVCEDTPIRPAMAPVGTRWHVSCTTDGAEETGSGAVVARKRWSLRGGPTRTEELIRKTTRFTGGIRGAARHDLWFDSKSGVPVRVVMVSRTTNDSAVGDVHYEEDVTLLLTSLTSRR